MYICHVNIVYLYFSYFIRCLLVINAHVQDIKNMFKIKKNFGTEEVEGIVRMKIVRSLSRSVVKSIFLTETVLLELFEVSSKSSNLS